MSTPESSSLGKSVHYAEHYDASLLFAIPRADARAELGVGEALPFIGVDLWNGYELSWLDPRGKPRVAIIELRVPANSPNLIESKSLKLYLNGFMQTAVNDADTLRQRIAADLSECAGAPVSVVITALSARDAFHIEALEGELIDDLPIDVEHYGPPDADFLQVDDSQVVAETLVSHLLKSNCPVTGQPDWASLQVRYRGPRIDRAGLLRYLVSYRRHREFHEQCAERVFMDLMAHCGCQQLSVYARYTRRGGLDINPFRATPGSPLPDNPRLPRQ